MKLTFIGAAGIVTGSCYLLDTGTTKILIDCGLFQGTKDITRLNYEPFPYDPKSISYLLLTHAHADHCGLIPKLVNQGFRGKIIATPPTIDLANITLLDSAHVNETDTMEENKRRTEQHLPPRAPLYTLDDVKKASTFFSPTNYDKPFTLTKDLTATFRNAGHILGSSTIEVCLNSNGKTTRIVFSGDLGQWTNPLLSPPTLIEQADYVLVESTYGDRSHEDPTARGTMLSNEITDTFKRGGKLLIPSFAIERTQELLYYMHCMIRDGGFPAEKVFLDSPFAINATDVFKKHLDYFCATLRAEFSDPFTFGQLQYLKTMDDSKTLNNYSNSCIIIAGSGMCNAGRIRNHLEHNISNPKNTVLFVGYQADGTPGRYLIEGAKTLKMKGLELEVKAKIDRIDGFSAHSDAAGLTRWLNGFKQKPKTVFIIHGEESAAKDFESSLNGLGFKTLVPALMQTVDLF